MLTVLITTVMNMIVTRNEDDHGNGCGEADAYIQKPTERNHVYHPTRCPDSPRPEPSTGNLAFSCPHPELSSNPGTSSRKQSQISYCESDLLF